jgi:hypothetical protein
MQEQICRYAERARREHGALVHVRVGVNSGDVVVRSVGSDLRMDYTAVGCPQPQGQRPPREAEFTGQGGNAAASAAALPGDRRDRMPKGHRIPHRGTRPAAP